jgi:hypothetical protein
MLATLLPATAGAAELIPGRPGRYELAAITIDATSGDCKATYETPAEGNLWMRGEDASVRVVAGPNWVHVTCRFTDISRLIEANAEVGHTPDACTLVTDAATLTGGWGIATSAANIGERADGGNSMVRCRFRSEPVPEPVDPLSHRVERGVARGRVTADERRERQPATARQPSRARPARDARVGRPIQAVGAGKSNRSGKNLKQPAPAEPTEPRGGGKDRPGHARAAKRSR